MWRKRKNPETTAQTERAVQALQAAQEQADQARQINDFISRTTQFLAELNLENGFSEKMAAAYRGDNR